MAADSVSDQDRWLNASRGDESTYLVASNDGIMQDVPVHDISRRSIFLSGASSRSSSKVPTSPRVQTPKGITLKRKAAFGPREDGEQEAMAKKNSEMLEDDEGEEEEEEEKKLKPKKAKAGTQRVTEAARVVADGFMERSDAVGRVSPAESKHSHANRSISLDPDGDRVSITRASIANMDDATVACLARRCAQLPEFQKRMDANDLRERFNDECADELGRSIDTFYRGLFDGSESASREDVQEMARELSVKFALRKEHQGRNTTPYASHLGMEGEADTVRIMQVAENLFGGPVQPNDTNVEVRLNRYKKQYVTEVDMLAQLFDHAFPDAESGLVSAIIARLNALRTSITYLFGLRMCELRVFNLSHIGNTVNGSDGVPDHQYYHIGGDQVELPRAVTELGPNEYLFCGRMSAVFKQQDQINQAGFAGGKRYVKLVSCDGKLKRPFMASSECDWTKKEKDDNLAALLMLHRHKRG